MEGTVAHIITVAGSAAITLPAVIAIVSLAWILS
jgi:hypothetical protein